ncbi:hypothetical protein BV25DRAFT_1827335 [Artomyces pyxidatus]|uniref:Uncharacterized protein n=1 Tax=Artomyces pyxidatus TaxID=48021 RepID=A0ACB8SXB1_9AGAM|nr:hypothetical protein BV25DRAFT_1827335 [Artomyces pyxidatus]
MHAFTAAVSLGLALLSSANAQTVYDVTVGGPNGETVYSPTYVNAVPGDQIVFHFNPKNHTVTQSTFPQPCTKLDTGFDSLFNPVAIGTTYGNPTFNITVNDTAPIWVYCRQGENTAASHCGKGMVFAVNPGAPGANNSFANFQAEALAVGAALSSSAAASSTVASTASTTYTAAYGTATIPPPPEVVTVTQTVTVEASTWTTTYASYPDSPAPTPASLEGNVHKVIVGGASLVFDPPTVSALPRDTIIFEFHQKNHTATQSAFNAPCVPLAGGAGFDSGFNPVGANATEFPTFNVTVNDTAPIWVFCRQTGHCGMGMVFAVNSDEASPRNFEAFKALAIQLNGTSNASTTSSAGSSSTSAPSANGASSLHVQGVLVLAVAGLVAQFAL